jgi:lipopolysaccharide export system protein LptA
VSTRQTIRTLGVVMGLIAALAPGPRAAQAQAAADTTAHTAADTTNTEPKEVELLHAGELLKETADALELIGDVRLRQGDTGLRANRATEYADRDEYLFLGDVLIIERGDTLRAEQVRYNKRTKVGYATGKVRLSDGDVVVYAPSGRYYTEEKRAVFEDGVTLVDSATVLTSRAGEYWSDEKRAEFYGDVHLSGDRTYLEADSVTYFRETEVSVARGNVFIERLGGDEDDETAASDSTTRTFLFGQRAFNDNRAAVSRIRGRPLLIQLRADSTGAPSDTLLIRAGRLDVFRQDSLQRLVALDSVKIRQRDFAAVADSVVYERLRREGRPVREESRLFRDPTAWFQRAQAHGDTLRVTARGSAVDSLFIVGNAFVAQRDTALDRISQLRGRTMLGLFERDTLRTLFVRPNAEAIYFLRDDETGALKGAVRASADRVVFDMRGAGELKDIRFYRGVEGEYYDVGLIPEPFRLEGFRWEPERRPTKLRLLPADVLERLTAWTDRFRAAAARVPKPGVTGSEEQERPPDH